MNDKIPEYLIIDVDGVMTTGQFLYSVEGKEYKVFGPHDNDGIKLIRNHIKIVFVTADKRGFPISHKRIVDDMHHELFLVSEGDRLSYIDSTFGLEQSAYIGDGFYDAPILKKCLCGIAPSNARVEARNAADFVTDSKSGEGAVLDACLYLINRYFGGVEIQ
ncbi:MAG: HAD hydrolase family protein [Pontiellaceae bacterium]|nr:HAD hydrolase family protein [Pontiellaceae bacterium]MBN2784157.1 HAD hydrolase family protein [Pontiellaceae bacterium]